MDFSMISAAASAISVSKELARAAVGLRDFNEIAPKLSELNAQLLKAQDALFAHNSQLLALQQQHFETAEKLRKAEKALAERGRYSLVELGTGKFAYRLNVAPQGSDMVDPLRTEPVHHVCQACFDKGVKTVLQRISYPYGGSSLTCFTCKFEIAID